MAVVSHKKEILFYSIAVLIPFLALALLETSLLIFRVGDDLQLFNKSSENGYLQVNPIVAKRYLSKFGFTIPLNDLFLEKKAENCYRVFILGESTVIGFPYDANISFSRILQYRLQDIFPKKKIEVVNTGLTAINSYTLLDFIDEVLQQKPDAILIYTGHNEFYGALGVASVESSGNYRWLKMLHLKLIHLRTYQLMQNFIEWLYQVIHPTSMDEAKGTLMQKIVGNNLVEYGSPMYTRGIDQFRLNMRELLLKAKNASVPIIISEVVSNIRDLKPFESMTSGKYPPANEVYNTAKKNEYDGNYEKAREEYYRAKDLDAIKFRAPEDINIVIHELGNEFNLPVVPMKEYFESYSSHRLLGDNLMTEHLHPNIDGYFIMSEGFLDAMKKNQFVDSTWDARSLHDWHYYRTSWGFTELDSMVADLRIKHLKSGWPFQPPTVVNNFRFTYTPNGFIDSLAFLTIKYNDLTTAQMHRKLGDFYASSGNYYKAFKEYYALIMTYPFISTYYYKSAQYLDLAKDYKTEIRIFQSMPGYDTNFYALLQCGKIFLELKEFGKSIACLQNAQSQNISTENRLAILQTLYIAYKDSGLTDQSDVVLGEMKRLDPSFSFDKAKNSRYIIIPQEVKSYIERGRLLINQGKLDEAAQVLQKSLSVKETAFANMLMGNILVQQRRIEALPYLEKAYIEIKDDPALLNKLCALYAIQKNYKKATFMLEELKKIVGENDPGVKNLKIKIHKLMNSKN